MHSCALPGAQGGVLNRTGVVQDVLDPANIPSREEVGLPADKIVYACSNQLYKYDPDTFQTWCNILQRVPDSVLWLLRFPPYGEPRIRKEAQLRGIAANRIIFTDIAQKPIHIRRSGLADVFVRPIYYHSPPMNSPSFSPSAHIGFLVLACRTPPRPLE